MDSTFWWDLGLGFVMTALKAAPKSAAFLKRIRPSAIKLRDVLMVLFPDVPVDAAKAKKTVAAWKRAA